MVSGSVDNIHVDSDILFQLRSVKHHMDKHRIILKLISLQLVGVASH